MRTVDRFVRDPATKYGFRRELATYENAEKITGFRLDRRRNYSISEDGEVEEINTITRHWSCRSCGREGGCNCGPSTGGSDCGCTGKSRIKFGCPPLPPFCK